MILLKKLFSDPTRRNVIINSIGNNLNVAFTALLFLILVRILDPAQYGVLSVLLGIAYVLANILDFGTSAMIYSYLPPLIEEKSGAVYRFVKSTFYYQTLFSLVVIVTLMLTFPFLDAIFFKTGAPLIDLYLTSLSVLLFIWQNFVWNCMAAVKNFMKVNVYYNISNVFKTLILLYLSLDKQVSVSSVIFVFGVIGPLIFFLLLFLEKRALLKILAKTEVSRSELKLRYTLTYFIASQFFNIGMRMDLFLLSFYGMKLETGYYGVAQKIILTIITTVISITQVLSPMFSEISTKEEVKNHLKKGLLYLAIPAGIFTVLAVTPDFIFLPILTRKYMASADITRILSLPFIVYSIGSLPILFLLYTVKKPFYLLWSNISFFIILTGTCILLIPKMGMYAAPIAIGGAMTTATIILTAAAIIEYKKLPQRDSHK